MSGLEAIAKLIERDAKLKEYRRAYNKKYREAHRDYFREKNLQFYHRKKQSKTPDTSTPPESPPDVPENPGQTIPTPIEV